MEGPHVDNGLMTLASDAFPYRNDVQGDYGLAYVAAIAHSAGYFVIPASRSLDSAGVDLTIHARGPMGTVRNPRLDVQVKTTSNPRFTNGALVFDLPVPNYDYLRCQNLQVPIVLAVLTVPQRMESWAAVHDNKLELQHNAWWVSLRGGPPTPNAHTIAVTLPANQRLDPHEVARILGRVRGGALP